MPTARQELALHPEQQQCSALLAVVASRGLPCGPVASWPLPLGFPGPSSFPDAQAVRPCPSLYPLLPRLFALQRVLAWHCEQDRALAWVLAATTRCAMPLERLTAAQVLVPVLRGLTVCLHSSDVVPPPAPAGAEAWVGRLPPAARSPLFQRLLLARRSWEWSQLQGSIRRWGSPCFLGSSPPPAGY